MQLKSSLSPYFPPARVSMDRSTIDVEGKPVHLVPGMAVTVEIKTGQRRVVEYLLSPLLKLVKESLREREYALP